MVEFETRCRGSSPDRELTAQRRSVVQLIHLTGYAASPELGAFCLRIDVDLRNGAYRYADGSGRGAGCPYPKIGDDAKARGSEQNCPPEIYSHRESFI